MPKSHVRYQIFVSSTYKDLLDERQAAVEAILRAGHIPAGMELFAAQNKPQMEVIQEWIEESDIFCLILGARYGSIEPTSGKSYVECEYDHAVKLGKPIFSLVLEEQWIDANVQKLGRKTVLEQENEALLKTFRKRITSTLVRMVATSDAIKVAVFEAIAALERRHEIDGWVRAKDARVSPQLGEELARLSAENARLIKELDAAKAAREERIDDRTATEWANILGQYSFSDWDVEAETQSETGRVSLLAALLRYGHNLGAGVANAVAATPFQGWLFEVASALASLGLAETKKTPPSVHWQRLGLSTSGKRLYAALLAQNSRGDAVMAATDFMSLLHESLKSQLTEKQNGVASAVDGTSRAAPATPPASSASAPPASQGAQKAVRAPGRRAKNNRKKDK